MQRKAQASPCPTIRRCMHPPEPVDRNQIGEFERKLEGRVPRPLRRKGRTGEVTNNDDGNDWVIVYRLAMIDDSELWPLPCNVHSKNLEASHLGVAADITDLVGAIPILRLMLLVPAGSPHIFAKLQYFNPVATL